VTAALPSDTVSADPAKATILTFPFISDTGAFDHESRETMGRWKFKAKRAGYFFRANSVTGDWVMAAPSGSEWATIEHRDSGGKPVFRVFRRHGRWHLMASSDARGKPFPTLHAALQAVHQTDP
jgi:hypothetical protein